MQIRKINFKSDFAITEKCEAGYAMRFRFIFFTGLAQKDYVASWDGETYTNCRLNEDGTLTIFFDDHGLGVGDLMVERRYYIDDERFRTEKVDIVVSPQPVIIIDKDAPEESKLFKVRLWLDGCTSIEALSVVEPYWMYGGFGEAAYHNEEERKANELQRQANEAARQEAETERESKWSQWLNVVKQQWDNLLSSVSSEWNARLSAINTEWSNRLSDINTEFTIWLNSAKSDFTVWFNNTKTDVAGWYDAVRLNVGNWYDTTKSSWDKWFSQTKEQWSTWFISTSATWTDWLSTTKSDWTTWFDGVKNTWLSLKSDVESWFNITKTDWRVWYDNTKADWTNWYETTKESFAQFFATAQVKWDELKADAIAKTEAADVATKAADTATQAAISAAELAARASNPPLIRPLGMAVDAPSVVPVGGSAVLDVFMSPSSCYASKVFQAYEGCRVSPDGRATFTDVGTAVIYVVPSLNDTIARRVEVQVRELEPLMSEEGDEITTEDGMSIAI